MVRERIPVDVSEMPDVARLAEEVRVSRTPRVLRRDGEDMAVLIPAPRSTRRRTKRHSEADWEAFRASAGSWKDVDTDKLIADISESRRSSRPPVEL